MFVVAHVGPEATLPTPFVSTHKYVHRRIIRPQDSRLNRQLELQLVEWFQKFGGGRHPVAQSASGQVQPVTHKDVFLTIQRQMVAKLTDDDLGNEPGTGDAPRNWSLRWC